MNEQRRAVLEAALVLAPKDGFTASMWRAVDVDASVFPRGVGEIIAFWSDENDAEMECRLKEIGLETRPVRGRIRQAVLTRLDILRPHKLAARAAAAYLASPANTALAARLSWRTADRMWRAAGDRAADFNHYTKRGILAGVYTTTLVAWFGDDTEDERHTAAFLDARIDNVLQYEKLKARLFGGLSRKPS